MNLTETILGLRKLGIGRSLSASEIIHEMDKHFFPNETFFDVDGIEVTKQDQLQRAIFCSRIKRWLNVPVVPRNQTMIVDEKRFKTGVEWVKHFEELYESKSWCKGFYLVWDEYSEEYEGDDLTQLDAIISFLRVSEIVKYLLSGEHWDVDRKECVLAARCAVSKLSNEFRKAGEYFQSALFPNEFEIQSLGIWADEDSYKYRDADCVDLAKRFCDVVIALNGEHGEFSFFFSTSFFVPGDIPDWQENNDFLLELGVLENPTWKDLAFHYGNVYEIALNHPELSEPFDRWIRIFNSDFNTSKWSYYFWEKPLDAAVWADSGFKPVEAALWNSIRYDPFEALVASQNNWEYSSLSPIVRAGMTVTTESVKHWGNASNSTEILSAIDKGFPSVSEYQTYKTIDADYLTIQRFNEFSKEQLSIQELSRAIALEKGWMDIKDAVAWSKLDQPLFDVVEFKLAKQTPLQASKWIECGIPLDHALGWVSLDVTPKNALLWIEHDIDVNLAQWFLEHRIDSPREGMLWLKYIPKKEIPNWKAADFDPISASDWREIGFGPKTSLEWLAQGVNSAKEAGEWLKNKFELIEVIQWLARSISAENAKKWRDKNISPDTAQRREQAGITP
jgi:hypothetical protein